MITSGCAWKYPRAEEFVFYEGRTFVVEWYYSDAGRMPGRDCYLGLPDAEQFRLMYMVRLMADEPVGTILPSTLYRIEDKEDGIFAFKAGAERFFNFTTAGRKIIITNGYRKHSRRMTKRDRERLAAAVRFRSDYLGRVGEGTYYEAEA